MREGLFFAIGTAIVGAPNRAWADVDEELAKRSVAEDPLQCDYAVGARSHIGIAEVFRKHLKERMCGIYGVHPYRFGAIAIPIRLTVGSKTREQLGARMGVEGTCSCESDDEPSDDVGTGGLGLRSLIVWSEVDRCGGDRGNLGGKVEWGLRRDALMKSIQE